MGLITRLQAVNQMLLSSGENLVADLTNNSGIDTGIAENILDQCSLDFQLRGLANNKIVRKIEPNAGGLLILPTPDSDEQGIISAEVVSVHRNGDNRKILTRIHPLGQSRLWNITDDTDVFPAGTYYVELISQISWEGLDTTVQRAVLATATRNYQVVAQGDDAADRYLANQEAIFNIKGKASDINDKKRNIFSQDAFLRLRNPAFNDQSLNRYWRLY